MKVALVHQRDLHFLAPQRSSRRESPKSGPNDHNFVHRGYPPANVRHSHFRRRTELLHRDDVDHSDIGVCGQQIRRDCPSPRGISPWRWSWRASSVSKVSKMP